MRAMTGLRLGQKMAVQMSQVMRQALDYLQMDNAAICGMLVAAAAENPALQVELPEPEAAPRPGRALPHWRAQAGGDGDAAERFAAPAPGLHAHVAEQIGLLFRAPREAAIAAVIAEALEPSGWLGAPLESLATRAACSPAEAERVLARLQQMEPAGLFARSLAECLALQLADQEALSDPMRRLLDNLPLLARGEAGTLAQRCGVDAPQLAAMVAQLRRLDPKPGTHFGDAPELRRAPDLIVTRDPEGHLQVALNRETLPKITVRGDGAARGQIAAAKWIDRTLSRRNQMLLEVAGHVVARQQAFLESGPAALVPLTCTDVARALGYHDSTISRLRNGLLVQTPRGMLPMEAFFARTGSRGGATPAMAVRAVLAELIAAEPPEAPLSDRALTEALAARGIEVSRRAVANHRAQAGIPPAWDRKRGGKA
ncbi:MAG: RNA polymerase factor sigma-54 [Paenirhodobacter sp.]|uniref:RNA polymerase factor sigma-54 n=1 Tax=Paenirhodobacter sp. TaxID=1965326 RepID=UPI003D0DD24C